MSKAAGLTKAESAAEALHGHESMQDMSAESLKRMIYFTRREAEKDGRTFCAYLLTMAANALDDDAADVNEALRAKLSPGDLLRGTKAG